jgi:hypothetical protein
MEHHGNEYVQMIYRINRLIMTHGLAQVYSVVNSVQSSSLSLDYITAVHAALDAQFGEQS